MFEPQPPITLRRLALPGTRLEVITLEAECRADLVPFSLEGRAYQRIGTTDAVMPPQRDQELLLNRMHRHSRWENQRAGTRRSRSNIT